MLPKAAQDSPRSIQRFAWSVVWQVGLMLLGIIVGSFVIGVLLDRLTGTRATFLMISLLLSVPLNLFAVYFYTRKRMGTMLDQKIEEDAHSD